MKNDTGYYVYDTRTQQYEVVVNEGIRVFVSSGLVREDLQKTKYERSGQNERGVQECTNQRRVVSLESSVDWRCVSEESSRIDVIKETDNKEYS